MMMRSELRGKWGKKHSPEKEYIEEGLKSGEKQNESCLGVAGVWRMRHHGMIGEVSGYFRPR